MASAAGKVTSRSARSRLSSRRSSRQARSSSRAMDRSSPASCPCGISRRSPAWRSSASRQQIRASSASSFLRAGPRRRDTSSGLTGSTVYPASTSASTSSPCRVSITTRTSAGSASSPAIRSTRADTASGRCSTRSTEMTPSPGLPSATRWNSSAQSIPTPSTSPSPCPRLRQHHVRGEARTRADARRRSPREAPRRADRQSSGDDNLLGVRPPGPSPGDAVSIKSSKDKRPKRSPGEDPHQEGRGISARSRAAVRTNELDAGERWPMIGAGEGAFWWRGCGGGVGVAW